MLLKKDLKHEKSLIKIREFRKLKMKKPILKLMKLNKANGYIREGDFVHEIVWDGISYMFPRAGKSKMLKYIYIFRMTRTDAKYFLKSGIKLKRIKQYPSNYMNDSFNKFGEKLTATDLNNAYWRIAYNLGIITLNTYTSGLGDEKKMFRLAALSTLGRGNNYYVIKNGVVTNEVIRVAHNKDLANLYNYIRNTCFKYMQTLMEMLKKDFVAYRTDCIYYVDTPENRLLVKNFFKIEKIDTKQLYWIKKTLHGQDFLNESQK